MKVIHMSHFRFFCSSKKMHPPHELEKRAKAPHQRKARYVCVDMEAGVGDYVGIITVYVRGWILFPLCVHTTVQ